MCTSLLLGLVLSLAVVGVATAQEQWTGDHAVIVVIDGLRPDYVTAERMPALAALGDRGVVGDNHHAVFPTVTRVNAASIATGSYPRTHGITGNQMYVRSAEAGRALNTGNLEELRRVAAAFDGHVLTAPSLGELLAAHELTLFAASSGSAGSGFLLHHRPIRGGLVHPAYTVPDSLQSLVDERLGAAPDQERPNLPVIRWAVDALLQVGLDLYEADVLIIWITEPDGTAHATGVGSPHTLAVLPDIDREVGRILTGLDRRGLLSRTNVFITSDHGFSTLVGTQGVTQLLVEHGLKRAAVSDDVVLAGGAIHVNEGGEDRVEAIVRLLQETEWIGPVFTPGPSSGRAGGRLPGTLSFGTVLWDHERSADILVSGNWTSAINEFGFEGEVMFPGVATHGSTSPHDIRATFLAAGPDIKRAIRTTIPTANIDIAPTVLALFGIAPPETMDGRVLREYLRSGPIPSSIGVETQADTAMVSWPAGQYGMVVHSSRVDGVRYVDSTTVWRKP